MLFSGAKDRQTLPAGRDGPVGHEPQVRRQHIGRAGAEGGVVGGRPAAARVRPRHHQQRRLQQQAGRQEDEAVRRRGVHDPRDEQLRPGLGHRDRERPRQAVEA